MSDAPLGRGDVQLSSSPIAEENLSGTAIEEAVREALRNPACAGIRISYEYVPANGEGMPITPPAGHLNEKLSEKSRVMKPVDQQPGIFDVPDGGKGVIVNTYGAQASRLEAALKHSAEEIGYPLIKVFRAKEDGSKELLSTSLDWPHRQADFHWKCLNPDNTRYQKLDQEKSYQKLDQDKPPSPYENTRLATPSTADAILKYFPVSALLGWWHSQEGVSQKRLDALRKAKQELDTARRDLKNILQARGLPADGDDAELIRQDNDEPQDVKTQRSTLKNKLDAYNRKLRSCGLAGIGHIDGAQSNDDLARFGRVLSSQIVAKHVTVQDRLAARIDPFGPKKDKSYGDVGGGTIPPQSAVRDVIAERIEGFVYLSLDQLRNLSLADSSRNEDAHVLTALLGLFTVLKAEQHPHIRSGTELLWKVRKVELLTSAGSGLDISDFEIGELDEVTKAVRELGKSFGWPDQPYEVEATDEYIRFYEAEQAQEDGEPEQDNGAQS